jgi:BMFP domain-containing protein YqiC
MQKLTVREELDSLQQSFAEIQKELDYLRARIERLENEEKG